MTTVTKKWKKDLKNPKKRKRVQSACTHCQKSHSSCDEERPCRRCIAKGLEDQCKDGIRKRRGRKLKDEQEKKIDDKNFEREFGFYVNNDVYLKDLDSLLLESTFEDRLIPNMCIEIYKDIKKPTNECTKVSRFQNYDEFYNTIRSKCLPSMLLYDIDYYTNRYDIYPDNI